MIRAEKKLYALARAYRKLPWMLGDAINKAEGMRSSRALDVLRFSDSQLMDFARLADTFPPDKRLDYKLPWSYFRDAGGDMEIAGYVLEAAYNNNWSREQMRKCRKALIGAHCLQNRSVSKEAE